MTLVELISDFFNYKFMKIKYLIFYKKIEQALRCEIELKKATREREFDI